MELADATQNATHSSMEDLSCTSSLSPFPFLPNFSCRILPLGGFDREARAASAQPVAADVRTLTSVAQLTLRVLE